MKFRDYQQEVLRTAPPIDTIEARLALGAMGIAGEAGEVCDYLKKVLFHGHNLDRDRVIEEIGDVLWYCALLSHVIGVDFGEVAKFNLRKLEQRYPNGFSSERSRNRE